MKELRFDSVGGAAGNMILGVLAGLGADLKPIGAILNEAIPGDSFAFQVQEVSDYGITGVHLEVEISESSGKERGLHEIQGIIESARMTPRAKSLARSVFERLAHAESHVHHCHTHQIHFHEVGAVDSIVDILGSCMAFDQLGIDRISFGVLPEGRGTFQCRHGIYPIPAPATLRLLQGIRVEQTDEPFEMITPTGAALLTTLPGGQNDSSAAGAVLTSACSFGTRKLKGRPNLLRGTLLALDQASLNAIESDIVVQLETNLDDVSGEIVGALVQDLLDAGALDVWTLPIQMKKQRPGVMLCALVRQADSQSMSTLIFRGCGTFGIRVRPVSRMMLERSEETIDTCYGSIRVKSGFLGGTLVTRKPEYEDCRSRAVEHGVSLSEVRKEVRKLL